METFKVGPEHDLIQINAKLLKILDELDAIVYVIDLETYEILYLNKHGKALWGDILGHKCWESVRIGQNGPCPNCNNQKAAVSQDQGFYREIYFDPINKKWLDFRGHVSYWLGERKAKLGIAMDITEHKLLATEYEKRELRLMMSEEALLESEQMFRSIVDNAPTIIYTMTLDGYYSFVSPSWTEYLGHDPTEIEGRHYKEYIHPEDLSIYEDFLDSIVSEPNNKKRASYRMKHLVGNWHWYRSSGSVIEDKDKKILFYIGVASDITEQVEYQNKLLKANQELEAALEEIISIEEELRTQYEQLEAQERELRDSKRLLEKIIGFLPDATFVIDKQGRIIFWNRAMESMTGIQAEAVLGKGDYEYALPFYNKRQPVLVDLALEFDEGRAEKYGESLFIENENTLYVPDYSISMGNSGRYFAMKATPLYSTEGEIIGAVQSIRDITSRKEAENKLKYLAEHDSLTGLLNRSCLEKELGNGENTQGMLVALLISDVDGLKLVNETLGHEEGDKVLLTCAQILQKACPARSVISRIGGDEFCVVLRETAEKEITSVTKKIKKFVEEFNNTNPLIPLSLSYGVAYSGKERVNMLKLYKEAEEKMNYEKLLHNQSAKSNVVSVMMKALEARDYITEGHADRLGEIVESVAVYLGMPRHKINSLRLFARFHDIGKVGVSDTILFKPGKLSSEEYQEMQKHSEIGFRIAQSNPDLAHISDWILKHHEWWNGQGYPFGLAEGDIPLECRILAVADAYDSMSNDRPYRQALKYEDRIDELRRCAGIQFDPLVVDVFMELLVNNDTFAGI